MFSIKKMRQGRFENWAGNVKIAGCTPHEPDTIEEICTLISQISEKHEMIRTVGAAHSFSPVAKPEQHLLSLHHMRGLLDVDAATQQATFWGGTYLYEVGPTLARYGLALENMGDIAEQTIAGAISTGTHGTGLKLTSLSNQVVKWGFIDGQGKLQEVTRGSDTLSQSLHLSLGLLGVIVYVTFQAVPLYALQYVSRHVDVTDTLKNAHLIAQAHRHAEWFYFPGQKKMQLKTMRQVEPSNQSGSYLQHQMDQFIENTLFQALSTTCKWYPKATKWVSELAANAVPNGRKRGLSYEIFPSKRQVRFVEIEYAVAIEQMTAVLEEIHFVLKSYPFAVHFPIEIRVAKGESGFLSPTQGQDTAYFAFHMYQGMDEEPYFKWVHTLMKKYKGRPHFGKINDLDYEQLQQNYSQLPLFLEERQKADPQGVFLTPYFRELFQLT